MFLRTLMYRHRANLWSRSKGLATPEARRSAWWYLMIYDHGFLRGFWTNTYQIAPGLYRSNQPSPNRLKRCADAGFKTILNLRGASGLPPYEFEQETCAELGLTLVNIEAFSARSAPSAAVLLHVLSVMKLADAPVLFHCKSGADRTSLASAMYLIAAEGCSVAVARKQLGLRYIHFKWTSTGVLDYILDAFEAAQRASGITLEDWLASEYDADQIQAGFDAKRR